MKQLNNFNARGTSLVPLLLLILLLSAAPVPARRQERRIGSWRPINYNVSLSFDEKLLEITSAKVALTIVSLDDQLSLIDLDFGELPIDSLTVNGQTVPYDRGGGRLNIKLSKPVSKGTIITVVVSYHGKPTDGLILSSDKAGKPAAVGDNWPDRLHHWIPCFDHPSAKATVSFTITAPANDLVVANGRLTGVTADGNTRTWTYVEAAPIPPYCMIIAVGEFARLAPPAPEVTPLGYYVPVTDRDFALQGFAAANPSLKFFSTTVAPYPYEKLDLIIGATRFGGMENSSAIVFTSTLFEPRPQEPLSSVFKIRTGLVGVVAHEIAHQWFGDSVTEATWSDLWLSEGFADYFAGLFIQRSEGEEAFRVYMQREADVYLNYEKSVRRPIHDTETEGLFKLLNANNYQKGAWVLHMLRAQLGDEQFFRGVRIYYEAHKHSTATTEDLRAALEKASDRDLKDFFARWVYGSGHPQYQVAWAWNPNEAHGGTVTIRLSQTQTDAPFLMPVPLELITASGATRESITPTGKLTVVKLSCAARPVSLRIDPDQTILKEVTIQGQ
jgi:aminopeptidase N